MSELSERPPDPVVGLDVPHESARQHVTGTALYTDDLVERFPHALHAYPVQAPHAHAGVTDIRTAAALALPGVARVLTAADVPGLNDAGINGDEPIFPTEVCYYGQAVAWVLADSLETARQAADAVEVDYDPLPSIVTIGEAIAAGSFQGDQPTSRRGDVATALTEAAHVFTGTLESPGQEHVYIETQAAIAYTDEAGQMFAHSSTQHPTETQAVIAHTLGLANNEVTVQCLRMGGGFGGKETQANGYAAIAALGASLTGRPVRVRLSRNQDFTLTGKRPDCHSRWEAGFDDDGHLLALRATLTIDGGWSLDLCQAVLSRALCHVDNAYQIPHVEVHGRIVKTNRTSHTAFRGFGAPQGALMTENILGQAAPWFGLTGEQIRQRNFYRPGDTTPYGQPVAQAERMEKIWSQLLDGSDYPARRRQVEEFNAAHRHTKRGLAAVPVKFGISFNKTMLNQGGALVHVYTDGSVMINHGGTEMGQGLHTKMLQVAATALGVPLSAVRFTPTRTDKVPNTSATSASTGADLNGGAIKNACDQIRDRLATVAAGSLGVPAGDVRFSGGQVYGLGGTTHGPLAWSDVVERAYEHRVCLSATGYYRTEGLHWDPEAWWGEPFKYFAYGAALAEVEVDGFTGAYHNRRVDIVHDVGDSLSPAIDQGQIEGGYAQGAGWLTQEDIRWDAGDSSRRGRIQTQTLSTYKLPSLSELPDEFHVTHFDEAREDGAIYGSKAVGEPPLVPAISLREALRNAAAAFGPAGQTVELGAPATPENVFWAVEAARSGTSVTAGSPNGQVGDQQPTVPGREPVLEAKP